MFQSVSNESSEFLDAALISMACDKIFVCNYTINIILFFALSLFDGLD
jgi:hypothetical protein